MGRDRTQAMYMSTRLPHKAVQILAKNDDKPEKMTSGEEASKENELGDGGSDCEGRWGNSRRKRSQSLCGSEKKKSGDYLVRGSRKEDLNKKKKSLGKSYPQY